MIIRKIEIVIGVSFVIDLPKGAHIMKFAEIPAVTGTLNMFVLVDESQPMVEREFLMFANDIGMDHIDFPITYHDTVLRGTGDCALHIFERSDFKPELLT